MGPDDRLRQICMALPEAEEKPTLGGIAYRVRDRIFAMPRAEGRDGQGRAVWLKAAPGAQEILTEAAPERFFRPPYVGPKGWIGIRLNDQTDWDEVEGHVRQSYALIAPKRLAKTME